MRRDAFNNLVSRLGGLTRRQLTELTELITVAQTVPRADLAVATIEQARAPLLACPRCQGCALHRHGHANGLQRFRCRACGRTFNSLSGTPLARLRTWLRHFCGIASGYLSNYCGWRWAIDGERIDTPEAFLRIAVDPIHS